MSILLSPLTTKKLTLHNRIVLPPLATEKSANGGIVSEGLLKYYDEMTEDGAIGLVIVEHAYIHISGKASAHQLAIDSDETIEGLKTLASTIQSNGSKVIMQINHAGSAASKEVTGSDVIGPTAVANPRKGTVPKEMSVADIEYITKCFIESASRAKEAGFDGVEIHSAHGYFLNQFYSPLSNLRRDAYGGNLYNRVRLHLEIIEGVRSVVGEDYPILLRLGASDYMDHGSTLEDALEAVTLFEKAGVDIIDISGGFCGYTGNGSTKEGYFSELTGPILCITECPVILTGGILDPKIAETLLQEEKANLIGVGRGMLKDRHWAKKAIAILAK